MRAQNGEMNKLNGMTLTLIKGKAKKVSPFFLAYPIPLACFRILSRFVAELISEKTALFKWFFFVIGKQKNTFLVLPLLS